MTVEEHPAWVTAMVDQRIALMIEKGALDQAREAGSNLVFSFLNEGDHEMSKEELDHWERTCDHCGRYIPEDAPDGPDGFYTGHLTRTVEGIQIILAFGVCGTCTKNPTKGTEK